MQELPVQMHPRYEEFLAFMADCPHRKTPETMQTAFWVWLKLKNKVFNDKLKLNLLIEQKCDDLDRLHRERDSFQEQARVLAEEVERLTN